MSWVPQKEKLEVGLLHRMVLKLAQMHTRGWGVAKDPQLEWVEVEGVVFESHPEREKLEWARIDVWFKDFEIGRKTNILVVLYRLRGGKVSRAEVVYDEENFAFYEICWSRNRPVFVPTSSVAVD